MVALGAAVGLYMFNKKVGSTQDEKAKFSLSMNELYGEFEKDEKAAFQKYKDQFIEVKGKIKEKSSLADGMSGLVLGDEAMTGTIGISMEADQNKNVEKLKVGDEIVLRGQCTGFQSSKSEDGEESLLDDIGGEVQLKKGIVVTK